MTRNITLLGFPSVTDDGQPSDITRNYKGMALLTYLLVRRRPETREHIADLLWDSNDTSASLRNLRVLLTRIRTHLPNLSTTRNTLQYHPKPEVVIDYLILSEALARKDAKITLDDLRLYRGDLLEGMYLEDAPRFMEWLTLERERLRRTMIDAHRNLCQALADQHLWLEGSETATHWLSIDPLDEEAVRWQLQFLAASGQVSSALKAYDGFKKHLWEQLGLEPEEITQTLAQELEASSIGFAAFLNLDTTALEVLLSNELPEPGPLPTNTIIPYHRNDDFLGRETALLQIASRLGEAPANGHAPATALTGIGGMGKTQTAVEFCYRYGRYFSGGVFWLNFGRAENVMDEVAAVGSERGLGLFADAEKLSLDDQVGRVQRAWQEPIPRLLIFDNCEDEALFAKWRPVTGGCRILVTSRLANWERGLQVAELSLEPLDVSESARLLQTLQPNLAEEDASNIANELERLPLALYLAGSFLRRYQKITAGTYLNQLRDKNLLAHPSLKGRGADFSPTGHELDVSRTFAINWEQLKADDETDVIALKLLSYAAQFAPGEPLPRDILLATVVSDKEDMMQMLLAEDALARLIALGFIRTNGATMLSLHRLVIAFVQTMLPDLAEAQTAVAQTVWQRIQGQWGIGRVLDQLVVPPGHVKYIMEIELLKGTKAAVHLAHAWGRHLLDIGAFPNSRIYLEKALALAEKVYGVETLETADVCLDLGTLAWYSDSDQAAWAPYQRAYGIFKQHFGEVHYRIGNSLMTFAILHSRAGAYDDAIANYQQALAIFAQTLPPDDPITSLALHNLAEAYRRMGKYQLALSTYEECLRMRRTIWSDDHPRILATLSGIGMAYFYMGDYQSAYDYFLQAFNGRQKRLGTNHYYTLLSLSNMGTALGFLGNYVEAISHLKRALDLREKVYGSEHPELVYALTYLGVMHQNIGELESARMMLERGLSVQETNHLENEQTAETLTYLASVLIQMHETESAKSLLQRALAYWEQRKFKSSQAATTLIFWGEYLEASGDRSSALSSYEQALSILTGQVVETHRDWQRVQAHLEHFRGDI
jgi:DNA-binding SARP family transcriptional activator/Tfp pilus assembly protein PilF